MSLISKSVHKNFVEKLKIVVKNSGKLNCSYGKVLHDLNVQNKQLPKFPESS